MVLLSDSEDEPVVVVHANGVVSVFERFEIQRMESKEVLYTCSAHQCIYTLLVFLHHSWLESVFLVLAFAFLIKLLQKLMFKFNDHFFNFAAKVQ